MPTTVQEKQQPEAAENTSWSEDLASPGINREATKQSLENEGTTDTLPDAKPKPRMTSDDVKAITANALDQLTDALKNGQSDTLKNYLGFLGKFHNYSLNNCLLIASQFPEATYVAGFERWKTLGRQVKKGEKGIAIFAPNITKDKDSNGQPDKEADKPTRKLNGFRVAYVFDISQTDGKDMPEFAKISGDPGEALAKLETLIVQHNITLNYDNPPGGALGTSSGETITVRPDLPPAEKFSVAIHELSHSLLHRGDRRKETTKTVRETEAEAVAFAVTTAMGLDNATRSSDYIALYQGDQDVLSESLQAIQKTAAHIIGYLKDTQAAK